jgi:DNA-binding NarL/FixJ family response regulator
MGGGSSQVQMLRTRVLVAEDDPLMRVRIYRLLQTEFEVVEAVGDGHSLVEAAFRLRPDVIVTDISMPKMSGIEAVRAIRLMLPDITFIFLTTHDGRAYRRQARNVGAAGYVLKSVAREELRQVIHHALEGAS